MIQRFIHNINPEQLIIVDGVSFQYNTTDSEGWTYWKELGKGNDLGIKIEKIKALDSNYLMVTFHNGWNMVIPRAEQDHPLLDIGV